MKYLVLDSFDSSRNIIINAENNRNFLLKLISNCDDSLISSLYEDLSNFDLEVIELDNIIKEI